MVHYLDDALFIYCTKKGCSSYLLAYQNMADYIGFPLVPEKTDGPAMELVFLAVHLSTANMMAMLPTDKLKLYLADDQWYSQHDEP